MTTYSYCNRSGHKAKTYTHKDRIRNERGQEYKLVYEEITYPPHIEEAMELIKKIQSAKESEKQEGEK